MLRRPVKSRTIIATCAALALSITGFVSAHDGETEIVTRNFEATIPDVPGKSLLALTNFFNNVFDPEKDFPDVTPANLWAEGVSP